ncbi:Crp/Fnr family transcriptional regulator [Campylobacterota bacterium]|nr:Crp/Fnr family transcriptional regulator [Campylobacterota bacterium]
MEKYVPILKNCPLFAGVDSGDIPHLLGCLSAKKVSYEKGGLIFIAGTKVTTVGIVLGGRVNVAHDSFWGNRTILAQIEAGGLFGEAFSCAKVDNLPVSVLAAAASDILLIDYRKIITICSSACTFHTKLISNMIQILARKNILLTQKIEHISQRTTREKLLSFLSMQARGANSNSFEIPFNREELAAYLSIDRSAMCAELSKMQNDHLLRYKKNRFELL